MRSEIQWEAFHSGRIGREDRGGDPLMAIDWKGFNTYAENTWCPGCVLPGTLVHSNPSIKAIEQISDGDKVLGSDGTYHKITEVMSHLHLGPCTG